MGQRIVFDRSGPAWRVIAACSAIFAATFLSFWMIPTRLMSTEIVPFRFEDMVPRAFGDWKLEPGVRVVVPEDADALEFKIYSEVLGRAFVNREGRRVMLLIAYGPNQSDRLQLHRPEVCYIAEGFKVGSPSRAELSLGGVSVPIMQLVASRERRIEPITYWMRVGDEIASTVVDRQVVKLTHGLRGDIPDGVLVRVSTIGSDVAEGFLLQEQFLRELLAALPAKGRRALLGRYA